MAQLIKLQDYISRYEMDLSRYPTQYIRLKKRQWDKVKAAWELEGGAGQVRVEAMEEADQTTKGFLEKMKGLFKKEDDPFSKRKEAELNWKARSSLNSLLKAETEGELKQLFLDQLMRFQINWASSTVAERSFVNSMYYEEERLRHFLQRLPDTYFLLYEPVFLLKKAPVEVEVLLLTPTEIWCLAFIEEEENAVYEGSSDRFWIEHTKGKKSKVLNPVLSAHRMEKIIRQLFQLYEIELPIRKAIISRNGYIDYPSPPEELLLLDKRAYEDWFHKLRGASAPLKVMQLRAAKALLDYCQTTSYRRMSWDEDETAE